MACFIAPATAAIIISATKKKIPAHYHVNWLLAVLWGGVIWLIPEHIYQGEVVFYPPFFTSGASRIVPEVLRVGIPMTLAALAVWAVFLILQGFARTKTINLNPIGLALGGAVIMVLVDQLLT